MECVIQSSMFHRFYLFLSILLCNVDSALVSDSNAYIWISNCIQMFQLYSNVRIYIWCFRSSNGMLLVTLTSGLWTRLKTTVINYRTFTLNFCPNIASKSVEMSHVLDKACLKKCQTMKSSKIRRHKSFVKNPFESYSVSFVSHQKAGLNPPGKLFSKRIYLNGKTCLMVT